MHWFPTLLVSILFNRSFRSTIGGFTGAATFWACLSEYLKSGVIHTCSARSLRSYFFHHNVFTWSTRGRFPWWRRGFLRNFIGGKIDTHILWRGIRVFEGRRYWYFRKEYRRLERVGLVIDSRWRTHKEGWGWWNWLVEDLMYICGLGWGEKILSRRNSLERWGRWLFFWRENGFIVVRIIE